MGKRLIYLCMLSNTDSMKNEGKFLEHYKLFTEVTTSNEIRKLILGFSFLF